MGKMNRHPEWDVVYRDDRYTLGQKDGRPCLMLNGTEYTLSCYPYEPCLYITDGSGTMTVVHNAFDPFAVLEAFRRSETIASITGREYDAPDFCRMVEYAAGMADINIDAAERVFGGRPKKKKADYAPPEENGQAQGGQIAQTVRAEKSRIITDERFEKLMAGYPGCVIDFCLVKNEFIAEGRNAHRYALIRACRKLFDDDDEEAIWLHALSGAEAGRIDTARLFAAAEEKRGCNYRGAFLFPPHGGWYENEDFDRVNAALFPNGSDDLEVFEWSTDWSDYFNDGHEWWGALCLTVYDKSLDRFVVIMASATD